MQSGEASWGRVCHQQGLFWKDWPFFEIFISFFFKGILTLCVPLPLFLVGFWSDDDDPPLPHPTASPPKKFKHVNIGFLFWCCYQHMVKRLVVSRMLNFSHTKKGFYGDF